MGESKPHSRDESVETLRRFIDHTEFYGPTKKAVDAHEALTSLLEQLETAQKEREGLREALDIIVWMSGADDFAPNGQASEGWKKARDRLDRLFMLSGSTQDGVARTATRDASRQSGGGPTAAPEGHVKCPECGASIAWEGELPDDCLRCGAPFQESRPE